MVVTDTKTNDLRRRKIMDSGREKELLRRIQKGDRRAFGALVEVYKRPVFTLVFRMTGSCEESDDLAQETFLRAFEHIHRFDTGKRFFPWLYTICLNVVRNYLKKKSPDLAFEDDYFDNLAGPGQKTPEEISVRRQEDRRLGALLRQLPPETRAALVLRFYQELPFEDIAEILGVSVSGVKMRVYRGLERLRLLMAEEETAGGEESDGNRRTSG